MKSFLTKDLLPIAYFENGAPHLPPLILIHGFPLNSLMWSEQVEVLQKTHRVITYDLRGLGKSVGIESLFTMEMLSNDLLQLMDLLEIKKARALGFSMGGYVLLRAHEKAPERFSALILVDTQSAADSDEAKIKRSGTIEAIKEKGLKPFAETFLKGALNHSQSIDKIRPMITGADKLGVIGALLALISRTDTTKSLSQITIPTLIMVGDKDTITPVTTATKMQELIPRAELKIIENAGHISNIDNPSAFNKALTEFLGKLK